MRTFTVSLVDIHGGGDIIVVHMQSITEEQISRLVSLLQRMVHELKASMQTIKTILEDTIRAINRSMSEIEGNTVFCLLSENLYARKNQSIYEIFEDIDTESLDISISFWVPDGCLVHSDMLRYIHANNPSRKPIFCMDVTHDPLPNWNTFLTSFSIPA
jgi:hypothetical protein